MGYVSQAELVRDGCPNLWWSQNGSRFGAGHWVEHWQPHLDIAQAMLVLKTLLAKAGQHTIARISVRPPPGKNLVTIHNWVYTAGVPAMLIRSPYTDNETQAICLAIKAWMDTQRGGEINE